MPQKMSVLAEATRRKQKQQETEEYTEAPKCCQGVMPRVRNSESVQSS